MKRNPETVSYVDEIFGPGELERLIPRVDCLVVALPLTTETIISSGSDNWLYSRMALC
jgi:phosphoglycerate dehydrogenase-like enzyme